ncbi:MAG: hypothetical protein KR126chlam5_00202 [Candidatus Anoxychlamydiales bacterium]|nr:hypothetical protein [Candidatus Anoxychlamydiales bacterium]
MLKSKHLVWILGAILLTTLTSCYNFNEEERLNYIKMGMSQNSLTSLMYAGSGHKGAGIISEDGKSYEAWEFNIGVRQRPYYFFFHDGKLVKWGQPEDWKTQPKATLDINTKSDIKIEKKHTE